MKGLLLLFIFTALYNAAFAQAAKVQPLKKISTTQGKNKLLADTAIVVPWRGGYTLNQRTPGVYTLPQDGMPCIVPNTKDIAAMPNAFPQKQLPKLGQIPNVTPFNGDQLKKNQQRFFAPPSR